MNRSNLTSNSSIPIQIDYLYNNLVTAGQIFILYCITVHIIYIGFVLCVKQLRKKSLFFINHSIVVNALFPLGSLVFQYVDTAAMPNKTLVTILCFIFEIYWPFSIYTRMYSILLIAVHRYLAVFRKHLFKKINSSTVLLIASVALIWFISLSLSFIDKYAFDTTYSVSYCLNGFSPNFLNSLLYALFYILFAMIFPTIAIITFYVLIYLRLRQNQSKINAVDHHKITEMRFANQFIIMCLIVVLALIGIIITGLRGVIPNFFSLFYYWRPVIRCYIMFTSSVFPIFSLVFNPFRRRVFHYFVTNNSVKIHLSNVNTVNA